MNRMSRNAIVRLATRWKRFRIDPSGSIAILSAAFLSVALLLAALGVDLGVLYLERREAQGITDLAAITAAASIEKAEEAARRTLRDNGFGDVSATVETGKFHDGQDGEETLDVRSRKASLFVEKGSYVADPDIEPEARFTSGLRPFNAVRVTLRKPGTLYFARNIVEAPMIVTSGIARASAEAAFSVGSRLLRVDGGILNAVLNGLLGSNLSLTVMDYEALIDANFDVMQFFDGLASELDLTAGTYDDVLRSEASIAQLASVIAEMRGGDARARAAMSDIASSRSADRLSVPLSHLFSLGSVGGLAIGKGKEAFLARANMMEVLAAAAAIANGDNQIKLDLSLAVPGIASLTLDLAIGEPPHHEPWFSIGDRNQIVRTAQTRLFLEAEAGGSGLLSGVMVKLPVYLELAYAEAQLTGVSCPTGSVESARVEVDARPGVADLWIAEVNRGSMRRFRTKPKIREAKLVQAPALKASGLAHVEVGNSQSTGLEFDYDDVRDLNVKSVSTRSFSQSLITSLLDDLRLRVRVAGLGVGVPATLTKTVSGILKPVAESLDTVVYNLLSALGIKVGEADIRVHGVRCQRSVLVQ